MCSKKTNIVSDEMQKKTENTRQYEICPSANEQEGFS